MKHDEHMHHDMVKGESSAKEYAKFFLIIVFIALSAYFLNPLGGVMEYMRWFMGVFFLIFASFKFIGYEMFVMMFPGYDVIAKRYKAYAYAFPFIELFLALLYIGDFMPVIRDILTVIIMGVGSIGVFQEIRRRSGVHCACLGNVIKLPLSTVTLVEDVGMGLMAAVMLILR